MELSITALFKVSNVSAYLQLQQKVTYRCILVVETNGNKSFHLPLHFLGSIVYVIADTTLCKKWFLPSYYSAEWGRGTGN